MILLKTPELLLLPLMDLSGEIDFKNELSISRSDPFVSTCSKFLKDFITLQERLFLNILPPMMHHYVFFK